MGTDEERSIQSRIDQIEDLTRTDRDFTHFFEAATLAQSVLHDTVGGTHPTMMELESALKAADYQRAAAASRTVVTLCKIGALKNPRLKIAGEIEGEILDIAEGQARAAEITTDVAKKHTHLGIAAFLSGASLEDALRRLCDARRIPYEQKTTISKLQAALYQPSKQIEIISSSETKHITAWGDTRNKADHGRFSEIPKPRLLL